MKIIYFITGLGLGGAETVTVNVANKMENRGHDVSIVYLNGTNEHADRINPNIFVCGLDMVKSPIGFILALFKARKLLKNIKPDVVHGNMIHANVFIRILRILVKIPRLISSEHSMDIRGKQRMIAYQFTDFLSDVNTNVSQESTNIFIKQKAFSPSKSKTMYNGIDTSKFHYDKDIRTSLRKEYGVKEDEFLFLHVGRLTEAKDHNNLLEAFSLVRNGKLLLLGKGELYDQVKNKITTLSLNDRVIMAGAHSNVADYYSAADAMVISSAWEGMPMVVIEAMSCSLPIITTNVGGAMETVADSRWIAPIKDPKYLASIMEDMMILSGQERVVIGKSNNNRSKQFDTNVICERWEHLYQTV